MKDKVNSTSSVTRKMTEEEKLKMEGWTKKAAKDRELNVAYAAINRRACARRNYQGADLL